MEGLPGLLSPTAWEGAGIVGFLCVFFLLGVIALIRGWIVFGPAHAAIVKALQAAADHSNEREKTDAETIAKLTNVIVEQRVAGEMSTHVIQAIREATQSLAQPTQGPPS